MFNTHTISEMTQDELFEIIDDIRSKLEIYGYETAKDAPVALKVEMREILQELNRRARRTCKSAFEPITVQQLFYQ